MGRQNRNFSLKCSSEMTEVAGRLPDLITWYFCLTYLKGTHLLLSFKFAFLKTPRICPGIRTFQPCHPLCLWNTACFLPLCAFVFAVSLPKPTHHTPSSSQQSTPLCPDARLPYHPPQEVLPNYFMGEKRPHKASWFLPLASPEFVKLCSDCL